MFGDLLCPIWRAVHAGFADNQGAVHLTKNTLTTSNSKHIDIRHHFFRYFRTARRVRVPACRFSYQAIYERFVCVSPRFLDESKRQTSTKSVWEKKRKAKLMNENKTRFGLRRLAFI